MDTGWEHVARDHVSLSDYIANVMAHIVMYYHLMLAGNRSMACLVKK